MPSVPPASSVAPAGRTGPVQGFLQWLTGGPRSRWIAGSFLLCGFLPWFFSCPLFSAHDEAKAFWQSYWSEIIQRKIDDPGYDYGRHFPPEQHEAKRTFRLLVPLIANLTNTGMVGVHVTRYALHAILLIALLLAAERACRDRLAALGVALAVAGTHVGTGIWRDACYWFDNCAHAFLALALLARGPWSAGIALLLAALVDERAFLALPLVAIFHLGVGSRRSVLVGLALVAPAYCALRIAAIMTLDWVTSLGGIGPASILRTNLPSQPAAFWFSLEGGWLPMGLALWFGYTKAPRLAGALALCTLGALLATGLVQDFTRSVTYAFPASPAATALLVQRMNALDSATLRRIAGFAGAIFVLIPNAMILGDSVVFESSLPVRALLSWLRPFG